MKKCIVIMEPSVYDLEQGANKMLGNGWIPLGGMAVHQNAVSGLCHFYLAMMHENFEDKEQPEEESAIFDIVSKLVDLIDAASDTHGSIGSAFTPEYQTAYMKACYILSRDPHEMLR